MVLPWISMGHLQYPTRLADAGARGEDRAMTPRSSPNSDGPDSPPGMRYRGAVRRAPAALVCLAAACAARQPVAHGRCAGDGVEPVFIPLAGIEARRRERARSRYAEVSSMAWRGDDLWLVPQYPSRYAGAAARGAVLTIPRARLEAYLDGRDGSPITPARAPFDEGEVASTPGYEGIEATVIEGERIWVAVELADGPERSRTLVVCGRLDAGGAHLDGPRVPLEPPAALPNTGYEAMTMTPDGLAAVFEANGAVVPDAPSARVVPRDGGGSVARIPFPRMEYRVTELTPMDDDGRLWAMNYFYPGDWFLLAGDVPGVDTVERLVELRWTPAGFARTERPPVALRRGARPRNWEGLARLPGRGVLAVTDEWPDTLLALIPTG